MLKVVRYGDGLGPTMHELAYVRINVDDQVDECVQYIFVTRRHRGPLEELGQCTIPINKTTLTSHLVLVVVVELRELSVHDTLPVTVVSVRDAWAVHAALRPFEYAR